MEVSPLSSIKYQLWLQERGTMKLSDPESYENCPLLDEAAKLEDKKKPKYLRLAELAHRTPLLVVENPKVLAFVYDREAESDRVLSNLLDNTRKHGCSVRNIKGLGVSVGIASIACTPLELQLLFGIYLAENKGINTPELLNFLTENRNGSQMDESIKSYYDLKRLRTNLSRMRRQRNIILSQGPRIDLID